MTITFYGGIFYSISFCHILLFYIIEYFSKKLYSVNRLNVQPDPFVPDLLIID